MYNKENRNTDFDFKKEVEEVRKTIQEGLNTIYTFQGQLQDFDKRTLITYILLMTDEEQYQKALEILKELEGPGNKKSIGFN